VFSLLAEIVISGYWYQTSHDSVSVVMGKGKLLPSANPKLLNRSSPNLNGVIMSWTFTTKNKLGSIGPKVFALRTDEIYTPPVRNLLHIFGS